MKYLSFLTLLALAFAGFASAQSVTVSQDTVYENWVLSDDVNGDPRYVLEIRNTFSDTLFIDSIDLDILNPNIDSLWFIEVNELSVFVRKSTNEVILSGWPEFFVPESLYVYEEFCFDPDWEWCTSPGARDNPDSSGSAIWVDLKLSFYFSNGDSGFVHFRGDYPVYAVPIVNRPPRAKGDRAKGFEKYLINGKKIPTTLKPKFPTPTFREIK